MLWSTEYETGHLRVDEQHKELFNLVQQLLDGSLRGDDKDVISHILVTLAGYTVTHFATEEELMIRSEYPRLEEHQMQHDGFTDEVLRLVDLYKNGKITSVDDTIKGFIVEWLKDHIMGRDKEVAEHYKQWLESLE